MKPLPTVFSPADLEALRLRHVTPDTILSQIDRLNQANHHLKIIAPAQAGEGILRLDTREKKRLRSLFQAYTREKPGRICKFVPASGAATRMFGFLTGWNPDAPAGSQAEVDGFFEGLEAFAFFPELKEAGLGSRDRQKVITHLLKTRRFAELPKALLPFHLHQGKVRTPLHEHLEELSTLAGDPNRPGPFMHLTVSEEHQSAFIEALAEIVPPFPCSTSCQEKQTDTVALTPDGTLLRDAAGAILFRPGGHGALIHNLGRIEADLIFIKNIDNVPHPQFPNPGTKDREAMAGLLLEIDSLRQHVLQALHRDRTLSKELRDQLGQAAQRWPGLFPDELLSRLDDREALVPHLDRPIRVCGMVPNQGEPGGGPFWVENHRGLRTLQIVEGAQIDQNDPRQAAQFRRATHFNPVDMVCRIQASGGRPYDLSRFIDPATDFVTTKTHGGQTIRVLEHPGLWNGAMADWLTLFVEMDPRSFCPVKTVNDLLRPAHQPQKGIYP